MRPAAFTDGGSHDAGTAQETVGIGFAEIVFEYRPQKPNGTPDTPVVAGWDLKLSRPV
jgi:type VI protein secretion system component Hcp